ncbi:TPA: hypothetical protein SAY52_005794 [Burkholderia cenocepacia]|uniref:hypothetical protein n=1 Tax=unclassified Burkholderia TaxID=2613784 RepID=UPI00158A1357|nr:MULTISPECIES: hypothetical protein [unclassified Burkholderia]HEF5875102.1 hypothetical protein [Burkholderia cenocepacia]
MDPVSTLNQVLALLRQQVVDRTRRQVGGEARALARDSAPATARTADSDLRTLLRERIDALRIAGVDDEAQLACMAIDTVLRHEFGATLGNEPEFQEMTEWVWKGMMGDEHTSALLSDVMRGLGYRSGKR